MSDAQRHDQHRLPTGPPISEHSSPVDHEPTVVADDRHARRSLRELAGWTRASRGGLVPLALVVGVGAGLGAVGFRWLIFGFTWLATGHEQFGQQGRVGSLHVPFLGVWFLLLVPIVGGALYGPLIYRFAREARGHGVPEVMIAVAENGGRIRPQVSVVKALASAICIGAGGSVGREGPIVQIGSALASSVGQLVRLPEARLRILVACGAAGGIAATFNAPITGIFFGFELILREVSVDALFAIILSSMLADIISQAFFGAAPFFDQIPTHLALGHDANYLLIAALGVLAGLAGVGFKTVLYKVEDLCDWAWGSRPEWLRPIAGGLVLGAVLLALPEMYGVGYPVMDRVLAGKEVLWLVATLMVAKMFTTSLTIGIGGSGGVFAPSLFVGAMGGEAFGELARHAFGGSVGPAALYGVVAMGAVFGGATQAPLTAIASVLEMTGQFDLALPVLLAVGLAAGLSRQLTHGTIYTTKLLRRGIDIDRTRPQTALQVLTVRDVMQPFGREGALLVGTRPEEGGLDDGPVAWAPSPPLVVREPQALFAEETLENALRQLSLYEHDGLPVLSADRSRLVGWVTSDDILRAVAERVVVDRRDIAAGVRATEQAGEIAGRPSSQPPAPLSGYSLVEVPSSGLTDVVGERLDALAWPSDWLIVAVGNGRRVHVPAPEHVVGRGDRVIALAPRP